MSSLRGITLISVDDTIPTNGRIKLLKKLQICIWCTLLKMYTQKTSKKN